MWLSRYFQLKLCTRHTCTGKENLVAPTAAVEVSNYTLLYHAGLVLQRILATLVKLWPVCILPRPSQAKTTHRKSKELAMHWGITRRVIPVICCTQVWVLHGYQLESLISLPTSTVKWTCILWTPLLLDTDNNIKPLCYTKPAINGHFKGFSHILLKAQLRLFKHVHQQCRFRSRLFQIDALTDWALCYEQYLILHCLTKDFNNQLLLHNILEPV